LKSLEKRRGAGINAARADASRTDARRGDVALEAE
jgi:hypothetical protein